MISILYPRNRYLPTRVRVAMDFAVEAIANALKSARDTIAHVLTNPLQ